MQKRIRQAENMQYRVTVPLTIIYTSKLSGKIVQTDERTLDLAIMDTHQEDVEKIVEQTHVSHEQALECLIRAHVEDKVENRRIAMQADPDLQDFDIAVTIGKLAYRKQPIIQ